MKVFQLIRSGSFPCEQPENALLAIVVGLESQSVIHFSIAAAPEASLGLPSALF